MRKKITLNEAKEEFPFVSKLTLSQPDVVEVHVTDFDDLATEKPSTLVTYEMRIFSELADKGLSGCRMVVWFFS